MTESLDHELLFWEKPGCKGNRRQQQVLQQQGYLPRVLNMLAYPWTAEELKAFFCGKPVADWFNPSAPAVKSAALDIEAMDEHRALSLMLQDPLLIRRPLLQYGRFKQAGFEPGPVLNRLQINLDPQLDLDSCPMPDAATTCEKS